MFSLACQLPKHNFCVAVSGGPDSMALLHFLRWRWEKVTVVHFNHGTAHAAEAESFVRDYCKKHSLRLILGHTHKQLSTEQQFRTARYRFFSALQSTVLTAHTLDDQVENYLFSTLRNGRASFIPAQRPLGEHYILRPFLEARKQELLDWCERHQVPWLEDATNFDPESNMRAYMRTHMLKHALHINPGLYSLVKRKARMTQGRVV